jgi:hypothetical protein
MIITTLLVFAFVPALAMAQEPTVKDDPSRTRVEITGCVKGSTLTETNLRIAGDKDDPPARKWRLRGPKDVMKQLKDLKGKELEITGTSKEPDPGMTGGKRIGKSNIYIGATPNPNRDPLPEQPTLDVESFKPTGESCR